MSDEFIESLRKAYMQGRDNISDECPMADRVTDYAFGELDTVEAYEVREHLKSCRSCLDLYMDIKVSEEEAEQVKDQRVDVLPGLQKAIDKGKKPSLSPWQKISDAISSFFGEGFGFRPVATLATIALVMVIGFYVMRETPTVNTPYAIQIMMQGRTQTGFRGGQPEYKEFQVESGGQIMSGDYFRFQVTTDDDAYVYVIFQDSSGAIQAMESGFVACGKELTLPAGEQWFHLDDNTGTEKL
ncbi:MAG: zf-HC2 domain-containing protein, partial [Desulfatirhabdiaceae bacterium]